MRQLILLRHAKAAPGDDGGDDFDRALAPVGRSDAPLVAQALAAAGAAPKVVLVSDARRTRETWELVRSTFANVEARFLPSLYLCPAETLMAEAERTGAASVMVIGHNPAIHELASRYAPRNTPFEMAVRSKFPTAAGAIFNRKSDDANWRLAAFLTPKTALD